MRLTFSQHISPVFVRHKRWLFGVGLLILITLLYWVLLYATAMPFTTISREGWLGMSRGNGDYVTDPSLTEPTLFVITNEQDVDAFIGWFPILPEQLSENWTTGLLIKKLRQVDFTKECVVVVFQGYRGSTAHSITIEQITRYGNHVVLHTQFDEQRWGEGAGAMVTDPYHMVALAKAGLQGRTITFDVWKTWQVVASEARFIP
jgi:hypothetical protein